LALGLGWAIGIEGKRPGGLQTKEKEKGREAGQRKIRPKKGLEYSK
jgi:hypothetical protein